MKWWLLIFENNETKNCSQIVFELVIMQVYYCFSRLFLVIFTWHPTINVAKIQDKQHFL